ncbi:hypothetical protein [Flavobacterium sp. UBA7682]|uniref:hypothetical protein n=1 Tax=Flavobacterium sp. UBA7682 TaxID=1946560 RepID=UPI0025B9EA57|nr:hypothetical protein [Flavobacterium sp. UBA7682]
MTSEEIIKHLNDNTDAYYKGEIENISDQNLTVVPGFQLIFGVTYPDQMTNDFESYKHRLKESVGGNELPKVLAWPFYEEVALFKVLEKLSTHYKAKINIARMMRDIKFKEGRPVYLVVTIITIPIVISQQ